MRRNRLSFRILGLLSLSLALILPSPCYALRNPETSEASGLEELDRTLQAGKETTSLWDRPGTAEAYARFAAHPEYNQANQHLVSLLVENGLEPGQIVWDGGSGTGAGSRLLAQVVGSAGKVIGFDSSTTMVAQAERSLPDSLRGVVEFRQADLQNLGEQGGKQPNAFVLFNSIHLMADPKKVLSEAWAHLPPGGLLAFNSAFTKEAMPQEAKRAYTEIAGTILTLVQEDERLRQAPSVPRTRTRSRPGRSAPSSPDLQRARTR